MSNCFMKTESLCTAETNPEIKLPYTVLHEISEPGKKVLRVRLFRFFTFIKSETCEKQGAENIENIITGKNLRMLLLSYT